MARKLWHIPGILVLLLMTSAALYGFWHATIEARHWWTMQHWQQTGEYVSPHSPETFARLYEELFGVPYQAPLSDMAVIEMFANQDLRYNWVTDHYEVAENGTWTPVLTDRVVTPPIPPLAAEMGGPDMTTVVRYSSRTVQDMLDNNQTSAEPAGPIAERPQQQLAKTMGELLSKYPGLLFNRRTGMWEGTEEMAPPPAVPDTRKWAELPAEEQGLITPPPITKEWDTPLDENVDIAAAIAAAEADPHVDRSKFVSGYTFRDLYARMSDGERKLYETYPPDIREMFMPYSGQLPMTEDEAKAAEAARDMGKRDTIWLEITLDDGQIVRMQSAHKRTGEGEWWMRVKNKWEPCPEELSKRLEEDDKAVRDVSAQ